MYKTVLLFWALMVSFIMSTSSAVGFSLQEDFSRAQEIEPVQPPTALIDRIEQKPDPMAPGVKKVDDFTEAELPYRGINVVVKDNIPFYPYYSLKDQAKYVIHPMGMGRFLLGNAKGTLAPDVVKSVTGLGLDLPNGGLAWYYPKHYAVARMLGDKLKYSSISQGTILAGLVGVHQENASIDPELAKKAYLAMEWPFEKGGINLADHAVLEMPSFYGPPEVILNGWIDALLHIRDYADLMGDDEAKNFFKRNVEFLTKVLPNFDAPEAGLSRYSDVSPYRVKVRLARPEDVDSLKVLYRPKMSELSPILINLRRTADPDNYSIYDNQILQQNGRDAFVWLSCSQLYDTVLIANSATMSLEVNRGELERRQSGPGLGGEKISLASQAFGDNTRQVTISSRDGLICGYPTNFSKGGKENYYHVYHVVGLMLLATGSDVTSEQAKAMVGWALKWYDAMNHVAQVEKLPFHDPQDLLRRTTANQVNPSYKSFDALLADAKKMTSAE